MVIPKFHIHGKMYMNAKSGPAGAAMPWFSGKAFGTQVLELKHY